ncbi:MAG: DUF2889 domain-containing protein [Gammaproteobacteria bacterium]|nr:DUF2889 domain-containing protein [Gammaproteobacteria bacterium]
MALPLITNPQYGRGVFRRRIRLIATAGRVRAAFEDVAHAMRLVLEHDGERITGITPEFRRVPLNVCPGAAGPLRALVGMPLATSTRHMLATHDPRGHCTHIYDLTLLAIAQALRGGIRQYDVEVPDEYPGPAWSRVLRDGIEVHRWQTFEQRITAPESFAGLPLLKGFSLWAMERFGADPEALEAAMVFHKGYLVSGSRRYNVVAYAGRRATEAQHLRGACHAYSEPTVFQAVNQGTHVRDLTDAADQMLADFQP